MKKKIFQSKFLRQVGVVLSGTVFAQMSTVLLSPTLSRLYDPSDFGSLATFLSILSILSIISNARYEYAVLLPKVERNSFHVLFLSVLIASALTVVVFIVIAILNFLESHFSISRDFINILWFIPPALFFLGFYQPIQKWGLLKSDFKYNSFVVFIRSLSNSLFAIILSYVMAGPVGLILGRVISEFLVAITLLVKYLKQFKKYIIGINWSLMKELAFEYKHFPLYSAKTAFLTRFTSELPIILMAFFFGDVIVGLYSFCHKIAGRTLQFFGVAVGKVFLNKIIKIDLKKEPEKLQFIFIKVLKGLAFLGIIPTVLMILFGEDLFAFVFGENWREAGEYCKYLMPWFYIGFLKSAVNMVIMVKEKLKENFLFQCLKFILVLVGLSGGIYFEDPLMAIIGLSVSSSIFEGVHLFWLYRVVKTK